ncbi:endonuclease YncB(thermonuclease family) [Phyllobacterium endophyticum]|uniref:Nuclease n=1 Tax=Phyllobacterium endophyticum TaxID=1149773 RepID=A0A2P7AQR8_9HYPH|nr:endonuclease YncB(thermonuclease family) [Phyllobacterium endophyticum]PSH56575.1 nuclease [Phyllobacterium endophyticum]
MILPLALVLALIFGSGYGRAADLPIGLAQIQTVGLNKVTGRVAVVDGRTLWFANRRILVRLNQIDSCELPQWAFDPEPNDDERFLSPVPCGAFAKAWLKRSIGSRAVTCRIVSVSGPNDLSGICHAGDIDLAHEMLRVGLGRLTSAFPSNPRYFATQQRAVRARYGMWATYALDMTEWRQKAVDRTLGRKPFADINLLPSAKARSRLRSPMHAVSRAAETGRLLNNRLGEPFRENHPCINTHSSICPVLDLGLASQRLGL